MKLASEIDVMIPEEKCRSLQNSKQTKKRKQKQVIAYHKLILIIRIK